VYLRDGRPVSGPGRRRNLSSARGRRRRRHNIRDTTAPPSGAVRILTGRPSFRARVAETINGGGGGDGDDLISTKRRARSLRADFRRSATFSPNTVTSSAEELCFRVAHANGPAGPERELSSSETRFFSCFRAFSFLFARGRHIANDTFQHAEIELADCFRTVVILREDNRLKQYFETLVAIGVLDF